jgi:benzoate/toluate 1,2-dioxygenase subunit alpha
MWPFIELKRVIDPGQPIPLSPARPTSFEGVRSVGKKSMLDTIQKRLDMMVEDNPSSDVYRASHDIFTDPGLFELEIKHIFEGNWIYLAHESQIPNKNDYFTTHMGRQPIFIARDRNGELNAFINACSHRGAMLCRFKRGNKVVYTCPFHGWTFDNSGKLLKVKDPHGAGYPYRFNNVSNVTEFPGPEIFA